MNRLQKNPAWLMLLFLGATAALFAVIAPQTLSAAALGSIAIQLPQLGILTLAMFVPVISGGLNLAITYIANIGGLLAAVILTQVFQDAGFGAGILAFAAALLAGGLIGALTRGGGISGMPEFIQYLGNGTLGGIPIVFLIFLAACAVVWYIMHHTRLGFAIYMIGSNPRAAAYSGIAVTRCYTLLYALSGALAALAGFVMLAQNNSMRIDAGKDFLLITLLACFLSGADPFGGFGRVLPLVIALAALQLISSGMNILGANQFLTTALWGAFLIIVMILRALGEKNRRTA